MIGTPASSPAAKNRFLYLSDRQKPGLTPIPSTLLGHLTSRLSMITVPSVIREPFRRANRPEPAEWDDESFDSILSRRFGPELARVLGSSVIHGIYAADSRKLSVRSAMAPVWEAERRGGGSIVKGLLRLRSAQKSVDADKYDTGGLEQSVKEPSVYSFRNGIQTLTDALKGKLEALSNVQIHNGSSVHSIRATDGSFEVCFLLDQRPSVFLTSHIS
jgi:protoporphyrinogen/coproporphyrinogen III oxidase